MHSLTRDPFATPQRDIEQQWERALSHEAPSAIIREAVRGSWSRSLAAHIDPSLVRAPGEARVDDRLRRNAAWLDVVQGLLGGEGATPSDRDHLVTVFDRDGVMLACHGDARVRAALGELNFAVGGCWSERVVGTNGPGTALATGQPVHILGAEHFCRAWHPWQCAATPLRDPLTGRLIGAIDISGPTERAHPHTLELVRALGVAVERTLLAQGLMRRVALLQAFADERARHPGDEHAVVDRSGLVVCASTGAGQQLREGTVIEALGDLLGDGRVLDDDTRRRLGVRAAAPLRHGNEPLGWTLVLGPREPTRPRRPPFARPPSGVTRGTTRYCFADFVGASESLTAARRLCEVAARNDLPVLLLGESGVGKEVLAQAIHDAGARRLGPFVAVNCAALPPALLESELFGYAPGAFTGAARNGSIGRFEAADGGTLFLDEVGELSHAAQAALLRALQEGEVARVGEIAARKVDVRVIAATQQNPERAVRDGALRRDLYYRLAVLPCEVPPLRARKEDLPLLVARFSQRASTELRLPEPRLGDDVWPRLYAHDWPGNVRELENLMRRLVATARGTITVADLPPELRTVAIVDGTTQPLSPPDDERMRLEAALAGTRTLGDAARALGIGRSTLYRWLAKYGLSAQRSFGPRASS